MCPYIPTDEDRLQVRCDLCEKTYPYGIGKYPFQKNPNLKVRVCELCKASDRLGPCVPPV